MHNKPHTAEAKAKQRAAKLGKKRGPHSAEHCAKIAAAHLGKIRPLQYAGICGTCDVAFLSGAHNAKFFSRKCMKASHGLGLKNTRAFARFLPLCAICKSIEQLVGDHDHLTGRPRGILCRNCNLAIGNMFDNPQRLRDAASYLEVN